jgi:hypothetical protein
MDYKNKYLKYKQKYLELKKELYGRGKLSETNIELITKERTFDELQDPNKNNKEIKDIRQKIFEINNNNLNTIQDGFLQEPYTNIITSGILKDFYIIGISVDPSGYTLQGPSYSLKKDKKDVLFLELKKYFPKIPDNIDISKTTFEYFKYHMYTETFITDNNVLMDLHPYDTQNINDKIKCNLKQEYQKFAYVLRDGFV